MFFCKEIDADFFTYFALEQDEAGEFVGACACQQENEHETVDVIAFAHSWSWKNIDRLCQLHIFKLDNGTLEVMPVVPRLLSSWAWFIWRFIWKS